MDRFECVLKTETDGIAASRILCVALADIASSKVWTFADLSGYAPISEAIEIVKLADLVVSHSGYHRTCLAGLHGVIIPDDRFVDTLKEATKLWGKHTQHGLSAWSDRIAQINEVVTPRRLPRRADQTCTPELIAACAADAEVVRAVYRLILAERAEQPA